MMNIMDDQSIGLHPNLSSTVQNAPDSFKTLLAKKHAGLLKLTLIIGPARGGTTAIERFIFEEGHFHGNFNQPGLLSRDLGGARNRIETIWNKILAKVEALEAMISDVHAEPVSLLVKETANAIIPGEELDLYLAFEPKVVIVIRHPKMQLRSRIECCLDRISQGSLKQFGITDDCINPATFLVHGQPLCDPHTDFSHIQWDSAIPPWLQHRQQMKKIKDYSSLGPGFRRLLALHPLFEEDGVQRIIWKRHLDALGDDFQHLHQLVDAFADTKLDRFEVLPDDLAVPLYEWDISLLPLWCHLDAVPSDLLHIVDYFDATHNQDALMDSLYPNSAKHENMVNNLKHSDAADIKCFDICSDGADWDLWYLESSGWDKTELSSHKLLPSLNPESIDIQFPNFMLDHYERAVHEYQQARHHKSVVVL